MGRETIAAPQDPMSRRKFLGIPNVAARQTLRPKQSPEEPPAEALGSSSNQFLAIRMPRRRLLALGAAGMGGAVVTALTKRFTRIEMPFSSSRKSFGEIWRRSGLSSEQVGEISDGDKRWELALWRSNGDFLPTNYNLPYVEGRERRAPSLEKVMDTLYRMKHSKNPYLKEAWSATDENTVLITLDSDKNHSSQLVRLGLKDIEGSLQPRVAVNRDLVPKVHRLTLAMGIALSAEKAIHFLSLKKDWDEEGLSAEDQQKLYETEARKQEGKFLKIRAAVFLHQVAFGFTGPPNGKLRESMEALKQCRTEADLDQCFQNFVELAYSDRLKRDEQFD